MQKGHTSDSLLKISLKDLGSVGLSTRKFLMN